MTRKEREKAAFQARESERRGASVTQRKEYRRENRLYRHARMVDDTDRDITFDTPSGE